MYLLHEYIDVAVIEVVGVILLGLLFTRVINLNAVAHVNALHMCSLSDAWFKYNV